EHALRAGPVSAAAGGGARARDLPRLAAPARRPRVHRRLARGPARGRRLPPREGPARGARVGAAQLRAAGDADRRGVRATLLRGQAADAAWARLHRGVERRARRASRGAGRLIQPVIWRSLRRDTSQTHATALATANSGHEVRLLSLP